MTLKSPSLLKPSGNRLSLHELTSQELDTLRDLNARLIETEVWIAKQAAQCLADYQRSGGLLQQTETRGEQFDA